MALLSHLLWAKILVQSSHLLWARSIILMVALAVGICAPRPDQLWALLGNASDVDQENNNSRFIQRRLYFTGARTRILSLSSHLQKICIQSRGSCCISYHVSPHSELWLLLHRNPTTSNNQWSFHRQAVVVAAFECWRPFLCSHGPSFERIRAWVSRSFHSKDFDQGSPPTHTSAIQDLLQKEVYRLFVNHVRGDQNRNECIESYTYDPSLILSVKALTVFGVTSGDMEHNTMKKIHHILTKQEKSRATMTHPTEVLTSDMIE